ncbi:hypothetical protein SNEBB_004780 [Seison nebaliae]|nr:hypothetical protein SNEBB_004780 [Seison nebaliae]
MFHIRHRICRLVSRVEHVKYTNMHRSLSAISNSQIKNYSNSSISIKLINGVGIKSYEPIQFNRFLSSDTKLPDFVKIRLPALSPTMEKGTVVSWAKQEGEKITEGDLLAEIETDKATMGFESVDDGYLGKIITEAGSTDIPIGQLLCLIVENEEDVKSFVDWQPTEGELIKKLGQTTEVDAPPITPEHQMPIQKVPPTPEISVKNPSTRINENLENRINERKFISPLAKKLAKEKNINLEEINSSQIRASDVLNFKPSPSKNMVSSITSSTDSSNVEDIPLSSMRKTIAKRLLESKQNVPHYYLNMDCDMTKLINMRKRMNVHLGDDIKISINDFLIKASSIACMKIPATRSQWHDGSILKKHNFVDISVAVATEEGLITPIIRNAEKLGIKEISIQMKELGGKAKNGKLQPQEFMGGTFTLSNLGMFGIHNFSGIINPPQSCLLAVGGLIQTKVPEGDSFKTVPMLMATLSCDHRVVDGAVGAQWLSEFKKLIEDPELMLL